MEPIEKIKLGVGTKELATKKLATKPVSIEAIKIEEVKKDDRLIGEKVVFSVKHPDKEQWIQISSIQHIKDSKIETVGAWLKLDEDNKIQKGTAVAGLLGFYKVQNLHELLKAAVPTALDEKGYLCIKAY